MLYTQDRFFFFFLAFLKRNLNSLFSVLMKEWRKEVTIFHVEINSKFQKFLPWIFFETCTSKIMSNKQLSPFLCQGSPVSAVLALVLS